MKDVGCQMKQQKKFTCKRIRAYPVPENRRRVFNLTKYRVTDYRKLSVDAFVKECCSNYGNLLEFKNSMLRKF